MFKRLRTYNKIMKEEHTPKCASNTHMYYGDQRNHPYLGDKMKECDCDGYHTFDELYDHRISLYIALCKSLNSDDEYYQVWRSKKHSDGELCFGTGTQFIMGIGKKVGEQISYHIPIERWNETDFAESLEIAPEFDGHSSDDVITRLKSL